jgi:hypothetical protein
MYFSNQHSLGVIFGREMTTFAELARRNLTVVDFVLKYLQKSDAIQIKLGRHRHKEYVALVS